jgi:hypothetical protein
MVIAAKNKSRNSFSIVDGDTIFTSNIPEVEIFSFKDEDERTVKSQLLQAYL